MTDYPYSVSKRADPLLDLMIKDGVALTRDNYLTLMFMGDPPPWNAEHESEIPEFLQDWESQSFGPSKREAPKSSNLGRKGFYSLSLEEIEELGKIT